MADDSTTLKIIFDGVDNTKNVIAGVSSGLVKLGAIAGSGLALDKLKEGIEGVMEAFEKDQALQAQTAAVLQSTSGAAGQTADSVENLAEKYMGLSVNSKDSIQDTENLLLTFTNIRGEGFEPALGAVLDMSQALGTDLHTAAIQVGKALQDPVTGITALHKAGVNFSQAQKDVIKQLVETGQSAKAQQMIIKELNTEFGGSAVHAASTLGGQLKQLHNQIDLTKEKIGSMIGSAVQPMVSQLLTWVKDNQQIIISLAVAGAAVIAFGAAVTGIVSVIGILGAIAAVISGPLTLALVVVAALTGGVVFKAMQGFQDQMKKNAAASIDSAGRILNANKNQASGVSQYTKDQMQQFADLNDQVKKSARDFEQSMAEIKKTHEEKGASLREDIAKEKSDFTTKDKERTDSFTKSMADIKDTHDKKVRDIQEQIDKEVAKDWLGDQEKLANLRQQLSDENGDYAKSTADKQAQYKTDTDNAKKEHDQKQADLQKKLDEENAFMLKHTADLKGIRSADALDEIDKLKQSHADQMREFDKQRAKIAKSGTGAAADYQNNLKNGFDTSILNLKGSDMGTNMATAFKKAMVDGIKSLPTDLWNAIKGLFGKTPEEFAKLDPIQQKISTFLGAAPTPKGAGGGAFADGTDSAPGGWSLVGERGPELVNLPKGSQVIPNDRTGIMGGNTINITNNFIRQSDPGAFLRDLSLQLGTR